MTGKELKERRETCGMTQGQLARLFLVATSTICRWEGGKRPISGIAGDTIRRILDPMVRRARAAAERAVR